MAEALTTNKTVDKLLSMFEKLRTETSNFYRESGSKIDTRKIRFTTNNVRNEYFLFKVKFSKTGKIIRFSIPVDETVTSFEYQQLEKTDNVIRDIDQLYNEMGQNFVPSIDQIDPEEIERLFLWGHLNSPNRRLGRTQAPAVQLTPAVELREDYLYWNLITDVSSKEPVSSETQELVETTLTFVNGMTYEIVTQKDYLPTIYPGKIFLINKEGRFNIVSFSTAKHHVDFLRDDYDRIVHYFRKEKQHGNQSKSP